MQNTGSIPSNVEDVLIIYKGLLARVHIRNPTNLLQAFVISRARIVWHPKTFAEVSHKPGKAVVR